MTSWGYTLSSEEFDTAALVEQAVAAEEAGFGFSSVSDHFHQVGPDQAGFMSFWTNDLRDALAARLGAAANTEAAAGA